MLDFLRISTRNPKRNVWEIYPKFVVGKSEDLMTKGGDFYAVWVEERGLWSTDEQDVIDMVDNELRKYAEENRDKFEGTINILYMWDSDSGSIDRWHKYCQRHLRDSFTMLDEVLLFSNSETNKKDYASKRLNYPLEPGSITSWDKLVSTLYSKEERHKIEWAIGSIVSGDSKTLQKFMVLYGEAGAGKSTILNIIQWLFEGYYCVFDAKALGSSSNQFALEAFRNNPLVAIQHDGDLSKIEDNTRLNSLISHEEMLVNEKHKGQYGNEFKCFLFMGTNKPVKITEAKSGIIRRLIDVSPSGKKLPPSEYRSVMKKIKFELGAIADHCLNVYMEDPEYYNDYIPIEMMEASNDFYNFVCDSYSTFLKEDSTTMKVAWEMYNVFCEETKVPYPFSQRAFKEELKNYFWEYKDRVTLDDGTRVRSYFSGFRTDKFERDTSRKSEKKPEIQQNLICFEAIESIFDKECSSCLAQLATNKATPMKKWEKVTSTLAEIDTSQLHFVKVPENHIVIDFDIPDKDGNKCFEKNLEEASKWPPTYAELSKSGGGIHLHYIYNGDVSKLSRIYDEHIEIKVFNGKSSLRRKLTKCNNLPIATISSGLPLKGEDKVINFSGVNTEKGLRTTIKKNLNKEIHPATKPSIDHIYKILTEAYDQGLHYDVTDMRNAVLAFAMSSTNQADYCLKLVNKMPFKSEEPSDFVDEEAPIVFFDCEVFPNLLLINWKIAGEGKPVVRMINPSPREIEDLLKFRLIGFNNRNYDNHILYGRLIGYDNEQIYHLSSRLVDKDPVVSMNAKFAEAYNISYTDVYDFCTVKQSLKKWEIALGIRHMELGLPWDQPVPEELWPKVSEYCDNDVISTEAVFNDRQADFVARQIQVALAKSLHNVTNVSVNSTTNTLSKRIIFGNNKNPQNEFNYRFLADPVGSDRYDEYRKKFGEDYHFRVWNDKGLPEYRDYIPGEQLPDGWSILPFFPGYTYSYGKSIFMDEEIGEGGRVYAEPGMYMVPVWDGDVASQHPHSIIFECLFGPKYTKIFEQIVQARVAIKHKDFELAGTLLNGVLKPYLNEDQAGGLANALKIVINSIYGLTSAGFANEFRDPRNLDNIVAKRGALFMTLLKSEVQKRGFTVAHIKTDSIKIPGATQELMDFVCRFGKEYGYTFETEAVFDRFCLVNNAVFVAKYSEPLIDKDTGEEIWWTATGKQFQVPYVFKTLFSKKPVEFDDLCEVKQVKTAIHMDMNEALGEDEHDYHFIGRVGNFCPVKPGVGGGVLTREAKDNEGNTKYDSVTGTLKPDGTPYRWLESEKVRELGMEDAIDLSYYNKLVDDAVTTISEFGDFEMFVADEDITIEDLPWKMECGRDSCIGCNKFNNDPNDMRCLDGHDISDLIAMNNSTF